MPSKIIDAVEAERMAEKFEQRHLDSKGRTLMNFRTASTELKTIDGAREYVVKYEYRDHPLGDWKKGISRVRATHGGQVVSNKDDL